MRLAHARRTFRLGLRRRIYRPLRPGINRRMRQHIIIEGDGLVIAPLGIAATPFLGNRVPIRAGLLLERSPRFLILLQQATVFGDRKVPRTSAPSRPTPAAGSARVLHGAAPRRGQKQREREVSKPSKSCDESFEGAWPCCSKRAAQVSPETAGIRTDRKRGYFQANTGCSSSATRVSRPASTSRNW